MGKRRINTNQVFAKHLVCFLIGMIFWGSEATAQPRFSINQIIAYDQNIFRTHLKADDWVNQTSVNFQYNFQLSQLPIRFGYTGDLNLFYYYTDRLSHAHQVGLEPAFNFNEDLHCSFGAIFQLRKYQPAFEIYNYQTLAAYAQLRWDFWPTTPIQFGYRFRLRGYPHLSELSYHENYGTVQFKHFFPTRTTFIGELNLGQKKYTNLKTFQEVIVVNPKKSGNGRGQSHGWGSSMMGSDTSIVAYNMTALKAQQLSLSLKFAQSIFSKTGVSVEYIKQFTPSNNIRYLTGIEYSYHSDDELYDDPYAYRSNELELTLTQVLPWSGSLKLYFNFADKNYLYSMLTDSTLSQSPANEKRSDQQQLVGLMVQKNFKLDKVLKRLSFYTAANYLANQSNDQYFDFEGFFVTSGFEFIF